VISQADTVFDRQIRPGNGLCNPVFLVALPPAVGISRLRRLQ